MRQGDQTQCMLDCFAYLLERKGCDSRPLYSGVWESGYDIDETGIYYFSRRLDPKGWYERVQRLYNVSIVYWSIYKGGKEERFDKFLAALNEAPGDGAFVLSVDLFYFPHSQQYRSKHVPHLVIFEVLPDGSWHLTDPYFSWAGPVDSRTLRDGLVNGIWFDTGSIHDVDTAAAAELFRRDIHLTPNPLIADIERFVYQAVGQSGGQASSTLFDSIQQTGVIAKRFEGYHIVCRYFAESSGEPMQTVASETAALLKGWESLLLTVARSSMLNRTFDLPAFSAKLGTLNELELAIRRRLLHSFAAWEARPQRAHSLRS
ncbi:DUF6005 family protein [Cohnella sp. 56]|uniref:DUF6005 family protein n=1 Tax=Cohnella sp. 56 TaxID=3113722 RepID=UPI0030EA3215